MEANKRGFMKFDSHSTLYLRHRSFDSAKRILLGRGINFSSHVVSLRF